MFFQDSKSREDKHPESTAGKLGISGVFSTAVDPVRDQFDAGNVKSEWWRKLVDVVRFGGFEGWEFIFSLYCLIFFVCFYGM